MRRACLVHGRRSFLSKVSISRRSSTTTNQSDRHDVAFVLQNYQIHRRDKDGSQGSSREYLLLPPDKKISQIIQDPSVTAAALFAHRNIVFGARSFHGYPLVDVCLPLLKVAKEEVETIEHGQQPQAVANLKGLSEWVAGCFESDNKNDIENSTILLRLREEGSDDNSVALGAVRSIATGLPRSGHSVVGTGTYRDGEKLWQELAKEYIQLGLSEEINLYQKEGGAVVAIEHLADRSPDNMERAGGAVARLIFT